MKLEIEGKRAIVTGAGRGIGRSIAKNLANEGVKVAVFSRSAPDIESLMDEMGGTSCGHYGGLLDLEHEGAPSGLITMLNEADFGLVDIVVHNLGGTLDIKNPFCSVEDWRRVFRINFEVAVELNLYLLPHMQEQKWGRVVHIASTAAVENSGPITYCSAKAALAAYSKSFGRILAPDGVVMTAVLPGAILNEGSGWDITSRERPEYYAQYIEERLPRKQFGTPDQISGIVTFLCSEQADLFQGSIIPVDGGQTRGFFV